MDRGWGFGEASPRFGFYVHSWHYELEWWSKCSMPRPPYVMTAIFSSSPMFPDRFLEDRTENVDGLLPFLNACVGRVTKIRPRSIRFLERL